MSDEQKKELIWKIIQALKAEAIILGKFFDAGDTFFALAFKSDEELIKIANLCGLKCKNEF